jgi:hypothetical protein
MITFWKRKDIVLGEQAVSELTILEWKRLFSLKLFHFHKTDGVQDRFHTHAFNAVSVLLHGDYTEELIEGNTIVSLPRSRKRFLFIPKNQFHRITRSTGCRTLLITGPWGSEFKELTHMTMDVYSETTCGAGRKVLAVGPLRNIK